MLQKHYRVEFRDLNTWCVVAANDREIAFTEAIKVLRDCKVVTGDVPAIRDALRQTRVRITRATNHDLHS